MKNFILFSLCLLLSVGCTSYDYTKLTTEAEFNDDDYD